MSSRHRPSPCSTPLRPLLVAATLACAAAAGAGTARGAPAVASTFPADQSVGVPLDSEVLVSFADRIDAATIQDQNVLVTTSLRGAIPGVLTWIPGQNRARFRPDDDFLPGERVMVTLTKGIRDPGGASLPNGYHFQFSTWTAPMPASGFLASASGWPIGSIAFSLTVGDLDGDRLPECIFVNTVPDSLTILTPDGLGGFTPFAQLATHIQPRHVVVTDVDRDGLPDLVCATSSDTLDVFRNEGSGTFVPSFATVPQGLTPYAAFAGDLDADGDVDIATANFNGQNVSVLKNQGDGTFGPSAQYAAGAGADSPRFLDGADFDGDGDIDLACCNGYSSDVSVLLNDGNGAFVAQPGLLVVGESPNFLEVRDYDGDGLVDIVTINAIKESMSFLAGNGDGTFQPASAYDTEGPFPYGITSVDVDGDADLDVVVPIRGLNAWRTMENDGDGAFQQGPLHLGGNHCHSIGAADWDGDGDIDVVAGFAITRDMFYYEQVPLPVVVSTLPSAHAAGVSVAADVTLFFGTDLDPATVVPAAFHVEASQSGPHAVSVAWNAAEKSVTLLPQVPFVPGELVRVTSDGTGVIRSADGLAHPGHTLAFQTGGLPAGVSFGAVPVPLPGVDPVAVVAADLDGDGASDLVAANLLTDDLALLLTGDGGLPSPAGTLAAPAGPVDLWAGDLDGNGHVDLACAGVVGGAVRLLLNSGGATFSPGGELPAAGAPLAIDGGDLDHDGDTDLVVAEAGPDAVRVFRNDGMGAFSLIDTLPLGGSPIDLGLGDLDLDGDLDLVVLDGVHGTLEIFRFRPGSGFSADGSLAPGGRPVGLFLWDATGDGWIDPVTADFQGAVLTLLESLGDGASFAAPVPLGAGGQPHGVGGVDVTGDGRLELFTANSGASTVTVYTGQPGGLFDAGTAVATGVTPWNVAAGDWNGDGLIDLVSVDRTSGTLTMLLNGVATDVPGEAAAPSTISPGLIAVGPNPFRDQVAIRLALAQPGEVSLEVFDLAGRVVATVRNGPLASGSHRFLWDGRDPRGAPVAAGVYFLRMDADGRRWTRKLLRVR